MHTERIMLIRHGQTAWNTEGRWQGHQEVPLDDTGQRQARALASYLRGRPISAIYSSDLARAWETALTLGRALKLNPQPDERLREFDVGVFQGLTRAELKAHHPLVWDAYKTRGMDYTIPQGESRRSLQTRAYNAWEDVVSNGDGPEVAIVSHGGTIRLLLQKIFEHDPPDPDNISVPNTSITTIERGQKGWNLLEIGATPHLSI